MKWTDESTLDKGSSVHLISHVPSDLGSLILIRIIPKERTLGRWLPVRKETKTWLIKGRIWTRFRMKGAYYFSSHKWYLLACVADIIKVRLVTSAKQSRDPCWVPPTDLTSYLKGVSYFLLIWLAIRQKLFWTGQSWRVVKSWYISGVLEQVFRRSFADGLNQNSVSSVAQARYSHDRCSIVFSGQKHRFPC